MNEETKIILSEIQALRTDISGVSERIGDVETSLSQRIGDVEASLNQRIDDVEASLSQRIDDVEASLSQRIDGVEASLGQRIDGVEALLGQRIDGVEASLSQRIDEVREETTRTRLLLENEISRKIDVIGEGHDFLKRKLEKAMQMEAKREKMELDILNLQIDMKTVKACLQLA